MRVEPQIVVAVTAGDPFEFAAVPRQRVEIVLAHRAGIDVEPTSAFEILERRRFVEIEPELLSIEHLQLQQVVATVSEAGDHLPDRVDRGRADR